MRHGVAHFKRWSVPPPDRPVRQLLHGLVLPFHVMRSLWADADARRRYLRVGILQSVAILALALTCHGSGNKAVDSAREREVRDTSADVVDTKKLAETDEFQFWVALFAAMQIAQWVVIALSHDYHDVIERDASLLTALEPEEGPITPRIRVDGKWLRKRVRRHIRGMTVFLTGMPVIYGFTAPFPFSKTLIAVLIPLWSAYWVVVFTTAKSAHAWKDSSAREPWFLRAWNWLTTRVPGFRWRFLQRYGLFWANRTRDVFPPASELEKQPWAFSGLAATRMLSMLPLVSCFLRPLIPVAAAHLLVAKRAAETAQPSKTSEPPAKPPDTSSSASAA
jgi:hypothetical protein